MADQKITAAAVARALIITGRAREPQGGEQAYSGRFMRLPDAKAISVNWYVGIDSGLVRRGVNLGLSTVAMNEEALYDLLEEAKRATAPGVDVVRVPDLAPGPDVIAILVALRDMVHNYWGREGDEQAGDGHGPPPQFVQRAQALLRAYARLLPPEPARLAAEDTAGLPTGRPG